MARAPKIIEDTEARPPEADRLAGWPHPREMPDLFGHAAAGEELLQSFLSGRMHHGWLLSGQSGIGKATLAYRFARHMLDSDELSDAGKTSLSMAPDHRIFRQVASLAHPGLFVLRRPGAAAADKPRQNIPVEEVRRLKHFLTMTAASTWRAVIVDAADDLNISSANALLKMLEEPPARTVFLIISASPARLFATIRSRCILLRLRPLDAGDLSSAVRAVCALADKEPPSSGEMARLALLAEGSPRRALELIAAEGVKTFEALRALLETLPRLDYSALHRLKDQLLAKDPEQSVKRFFDFLDFMLSKAIRQACAPGPREAASQAAPASFGQLIRPSNLALWTGLWETLHHLRAEAGRLNLDRSALLITVFAEIEKTAKQPAAAAPRAV